MQLATRCRPVHLTYCLNIHPGESWAENLAAIRQHVQPLRRLLGRDAAFGLGLRLSRQAADDLSDPAALATFRDYLAREGLYVFTVNGFPYGQFHGTRVKERVYAPDWRTPERLTYTLKLGEILAALLPEGVAGSISTVPGSYRAWCQTPADREAVLMGLARAALGLQEIRERTGRTVVLALEPEPDCLWDCTEDMLALFTVQLPQAVETLARTLAVPAARLRAAIAVHLGVCYDTCHQAVNFENVAESLKRLYDAHVPVAKIQVSAAPMASPVSPEVVTQLGQLTDPVYLHQTRLRTSVGAVTRYPDLPEALAALGAGEAAAEVRTHFHIPLSLEHWGAIRSTRDFLDAGFFALLKQGACQHIELETYTFAVLPAALREQGVVASLAAEFAWFLECWQRD